LGNLVIVMANPNQQITRSPGPAPSAAARAAADEFARLVDIMATLRGPDGCPWDREQTIDTLKPFVLEETYEVLEAIDHGDHPALREELGDFLFEAVFLAQLESEAGHFAIADSVKAVADKLVRRHPHVFARETLDAPVDTAGKVKVRWEEIKAQERGSETTPKTLLGGVPAALPALLRASQIGSRAASVNFDWIAAQDVVDKIEEEVDEIREVVREGQDADRARVEEEVGDLLFAIANLSRKLGVEPETALRKANDKFTRRFTAMEKRIEGSGRRMRDMSLEELESEWGAIKLEIDSL
jgi:MazG family protein